MPHDTELLTRVAQRAAEDDLDVAPGVDAAALESARTRLGFALPDLLAEAYRQVGNGGFGPEECLLPLDGEGSVVSTYLDFRETYAGSEWAWPEGVLPIMTWGCGMYACVDCRSEDATVLLFEPNPGDPDLAWYVDAPSLAAWFTHYVEDTGWWVAAERGEEFAPMPPWPHAGERA